MAWLNHSEIDDGLHYYLAKTRNVLIVSFDRDFDGLDVKRVDPHEIPGSIE